MTLQYRHNFKWRINELLSLQREYELLEWTIQEIACKHERTIDAILYRLQHEGFIDSWIDARGYQEYSKTLDCLVGSLDSNVNIYNFKKNLTVNTDFIDDDDCDDVIDDNDSDYHDNSDDSDSDSDYQEDDEYHDAKNISSLSQRVWSLETAVKDIKSMIGTLVSRFTSSTTSSSSINTVI